MDYSTLSITDYISAVKSKKFTVTEAVATFVEKCKKNEKNAIREVFESWQENAKRIDEKIKNGETLGPLAGVPIIIKDNILYKNHGASVGSRMLENFVAPYSSAVVEKLLAADAVIIARANMDELSLGSSGKKSAFGIVKNAISDNHIAGGTSSGPSVAVASGLCLVAIGTDTGGSCRMPASYNGIVGIRPTYGRVSRYGIPGASSALDTVGVLSRNVQDNEYVLDIIAGKDKRDMTSIEYNKQAHIEINKLRIGRVKQIDKEFRSSEYHTNLEKAISVLQNKGAKIVDIDVPVLDDVVSVYYTLNPALVASSFAKYDGVRYTSTIDASNISELYKETRNKYFSDEVKRRIIFGNSALATEDGDSLYRKALTLQNVIKREFDKVFKDIDAIILPTTYGEALLMSSELQDSTAEYLNDLFTVPASLIGLPALSVPFGKGENNLPLGIQIMSKKDGEQVVYALAKLIEGDGK
ncbi:MAG: aspartyl/glutamyl-tRNA amidotransferase subunit A [Firmicutes bacterium]|nr:aspartyl/glutamyl-tRNA amidotransferase subunit A [Bacillota bacterium]